MVYTRPKPLEGGADSEAPKITSLAADRAKFIRNMGATATTQGRREV